MSAPVMAGAFALGLAVADFSEAATGRPLGGGLVPWVSPSVEIGVIVALACGLAAFVARPRRAVQFVILGCLTAPLWTLWAARLAGDPADSGLRPVVGGAMGLVFGVWAAHSLAGSPESVETDVTEGSGGLRSQPSVVLGTWGLFVGLFVGMLLRAFAVWRSGGYAAVAPNWSVEWKFAIAFGLATALLAEGRADVSAIRQIASAIVIALAEIAVGAIAFLRDDGLIALGWMLLGATGALRGVALATRPRAVRTRRSLSTVAESTRASLGDAGRVVRERWLPVAAASVAVAGAVAAIWLLRGNDRPRYRYPQSAARYWDRNCGLGSDEGCECAWQLIQERIPYSDWDFFTFHQEAGQAARARRVGEAIDAVVADCTS